MFSDSRSTSILNAGAKSYKVAVETVESVQMVHLEAQRAPRDAARACGDTGQRSGTIMAIRLYIPYRYLIYWPAPWFPADDS